MEKELETKIFLKNEYICKKDMEESIKEYIQKLKKKYPEAIVTKEFYKEQNILVRATKIVKKTNLKENLKKQERELDEWYIRSREQ